MLLESGLGAAAELWGPKPKLPAQHFVQGSLVGFFRRAAVAGFATYITPHQSPSDASHEAAGLA